MNFAVIDIGTNTFNLLIVHQNGNVTPEVIYKTREPVKLGEGITNGLIAPAAFKRGTEALRKFNRLIETYKCDRIKALATSAIRSTRNGPEFVEAVKRKTGIYIEVIEGWREAELIWKGIRTAVRINGKSLLMDIGGGSTEFILADENRMYWSHSFELGVTRLFEQFTPSDPMLASEILQVEGFIRNKMAEVFKIIDEYQPQHLIGSSGSFSTFGQIIAHQQDQGEGFHDRLLFPIKVADFCRVHEQIIRSTLSERLATKGISAFRAEYIGLSSIVTKVMIDHGNFRSMTYSANNMKEGFLSESISDTF